MASSLTGSGIWHRVTSDDPAHAADNDLAWEYMFVLGRGGKPGSREIHLPGFPPVDPTWVVDVIMGKRESGESSERVRPPDPESSGDRCVLCLLRFGAEYEDPAFGWVTVKRNPRNRYYCTLCDAFIRVCPGKAKLTMPVLVADVKESRRIRRELGDLAAYSRLVGRFQREVEWFVQEHMGLVLNTVGDAVIGVWPSGFVTSEARREYDWDDANPARVPAMLALRAAEDLTAIAPAEFDGERLPFRAAVDTSEMIVFAVTTADADAAGVFAPGALEAREVGDPVLGADPSYFGTGPAAADVAGEAVEVASELASARAVPGGAVCVTRRTDETAGTPLDEDRYTVLAEDTPPSRIVQAA